MRKILYSPGYGAGWSSWESDDNLKKFMIEYKPIIEFLENGGKFIRGKDEKEIRKRNPILDDFAKECLLRFGKVPCLLGCVDLEVEETPDGLVKITDYDGNESIEYCYESWL